MPVDQPKVFGQTVRNQGGEDEASAEGYAQGPKHQERRRISYIHVPAEHEQPETHDKQDDSGLE